MIYTTEVVVHSRREGFNKLLDQAVTTLQAQGLSVEIQFQKDRGSYNALIIARHTV
jgi:hypothetical protein